MEILADRPCPDGEEAKVAKFCIVEHLKRYSWRNRGTEAWPILSERGPRIQAKWCDDSEARSEMFV